MDKNIKFQQNINKLNLIIIVLRAFDNKYSSVAKLIPKLVLELEKIDLKKSEKLIELSE
jgi:hypothetical protein